MNLSEPFIRRPVMTTLVMAAILLFGLAAYRSLPVSDLPQVDYPTIQVQVGLPGAICCSTIGQILCRVPHARNDARGFFLPLHGTG